jgi:hypothetical protein
MSGTNDAKIMEMRKLIEDKKAKLKESAKSFSPITSCSICLDNTQINIHTLQVDDLRNLMIVLNSYKMSAENLQVLDDYVISGYHITQWINDIKAKLEVVSRRKEEEKLKIMEQKLTKLLSEDKKTELELDNIMNELK